MKHPSPSLLHHLRHSVLVRMAVVMGILALLSLASIVISTLIADDISGRASAVNVSGSLRMLSFRALSEMQQTEKQMLALETMKQFEHRLLSLERFSISKSPQDAPANLAVRAVLQRWNSQIRPLELAAASGDAAALAQAAVEIPDFVNQIDHVVRLIEEELESKATLLRVIQLGLLAGIVIISIFTIWMLHLQLVQPLAHLLEAAKTVSQGSFSARVAHVSDDELGQLGRAFNTMVSEIAHMYAHLEDKVQEKTRELTRINESLELLYRTSQQLAASDLTLDTVQTTLRDIEAALELGHSAICISENRQFPAHPVVGNMAPEEMHTLCGQLDCSHCFAAAREPLSEQVHALPMVVVPISDSDKLHGTLPIFLKPGSVLTPEKIRIIETVGHHISNALSNMQRNEEKHRLAVLEERSVIARELHDSIAQSLSYLKIQVTRLEKCINQGCDPRTITDELKQGLNTAYRELRELITTFRLRIDERGFNAALHATITEFSDKLGFPIRLGNSLSGIILSGNEEMHVIRIIREALSNIERHAQASKASVYIALDKSHQVTIRVHDDGKGFDPSQTPANHFGTSIMQDRALILDGHLDIDSAPGRGTIITLQFLPQIYRQTDSESSEA